MSCYRRYTRYLYNPKREEEGGINPYQAGYTEFCKTVVNERLLRNREVLRLSRLNEIFKTIVREKEGLDISAYKAFSLKARLQKSHPFLKFLRSATNDFVYVEDLTADEVIQDEARQPPSDSSEDDATDAHLGPQHRDDPARTGLFIICILGYNSYQTVLQTFLYFTDCTCISSDKLSSFSTDTRQLYHAALSLKEIIEANCKITPKLPWPPTAQDLKMDTASNVVPNELYNFITWTAGITNEFTTDGLRVNVSVENNQKILSTCQDVMNLTMRGRWLMPKHSSLAMAVRHMTGSAQLIGILNGLGHCSSNTQVLEHDTALAELQLLRGDAYIPSNITAQFQATLVWDNNDFGEETLSGKGTTHNTNGIIIQRPITCDVSVSETVSLQRTRKRSLEPPPAHIDTYIRRKRTGPKPFGTNIELGHEKYSYTQEYARQLDSAYFFMKVPEVHLKALSGWTGHNTLLHRGMIPLQSSIGYLPVIDASPTDLHTVHTILSRSIEIADKLELKEIVLVMDQAIYSKAQEIRWMNTTFMERLVLRMGEFHTAMAYLSCIGKRFKDAGFQDVIVEAEVVAAGSLEGVISGHHYNRSMRIHKLMCEALQRLRWQAYLDILSAEDREAAMEIAADLQRAFPGEDFDNLVMSEKYLRVKRGYDSFIKNNTTNKTFHFWSTYISMVEDLLLFIRGTREANWSLHLSSVRSILPWFFAYDGINYARYLSTYWMEMSCLQDTHPNIHHQLQSGDFVAQRQQTYAFSNTACDQVIEQTANRDSKTKGGLTGFSLNKGAVHRWTLTQHERAAITMECRDMAGHNTTTRQRAELDDTRTGRDELDIKNIMSSIQNMINPFDPSIDREVLYQITSGQVASDAISADLFDAKERGEKALLDFCEKRLQTHEVGIYDPIKKMKLKTFKDTATSSVTKTKGKEVTLRADCDLFARLIVVGTVRKIDLQEMLVYSLGPLPASLAHFDGSLMKTDKAKLMRFLEAAVNPPATVENIPEGSTWIWDAMALVQVLKPQPTFGMFADSALRSIVSTAKTSKSKVIHFVPDTYQNMSIKNAERARRAVKGALITKIYSEDQKTPKQWAKFLACGENKENLLQFIFERWCKSGRDLIQDLTLIVGHGGECHALRKDGTTGDLEVSPMPALFTIQEEADTRLMLHCAHAASYSQHIVIRSPDTDVFVLALAFAKEVGAHLYFHTGSGVNTRTVDVQQVHNHLGADVCDALIGLHCFSGCDTVSSLYGIGKTKAVKTLLSNRDHCTTFKQLGTSFTITEELYDSVEAFTCELYDRKGLKEVNTARWQMFKTGKCVERSLPPNKDSLKLHIQRANYQAAIYRRSLETQPDIPPPMQHGWSIEGESFAIKWMTLPPAPKSLLELVHCQCKATHCVQGRCTCRQNQLPCTDMCRCVECSNCADGHETEN